MRIFENCGVAGTELSVLGGPGKTGAGREGVEDGADMVRAVLMKMGLRESFKLVTQEVLI